MSSRFAQPTRILMLSLLLPLASAALAEPSLQEVYQTARAGNLAQAETMMTEVVQAHPDSAKAHFVFAEILAKDNRLSDAQHELARAEQLKPGLPDEKPAAVAALKRKLQVHNSPSGSGGSPVLMWAGLAAIIIFGVMIFRTLFRRPQPQAYAAAGFPPAGYGNNPMSGPMPGGYGPNGPYQGGPQGGGLGSSIIGGLATGAAVGAGIVAGEALMRNVLDDHPANSGHSTTPNQTQSQPQTDDGYDMGGNNFGVNDSSSWNDGGSSWSDNSSFDSDDSGDWS